jgi:regulator of protease activity HflC (stomatin/prohibitin superfamily)
MINTATHQRRRLSRIAITAAATVLAIGLLSAGSVLYSTNSANAVTTPTFGTFSRAVETPGTLGIVPSPVIDTNSEFFFGTGDGSVGYYAEGPNQ